jgi:hypothetical protein
VLDALAVASLPAKRQRPCPPERQPESNPFALVMVSRISASADQMNDGHDLPPG